MLKSPAEPAACRGQGNHFPSGLRRRGSRLWRAEAIPWPLFMDTLLKIDSISVKYCAISFFTAAIKSAKVTIPSVDKGRHGFDGQKYAHTASSPLEIRQVFPAGLSLSGHISARQNCFAPACDGFPSDFWILSCRRSGARQGEKDKNRRKGALAGVFALVNRW